jgi:hypothetical protein
MNLPLLALCLGACASQEISPNPTVTPAPVVQRELRLHWVRLAPLPLESDDAATSAPPPSRSSWPPTLGDVFERRAEERERMQDLAELAARFCEPPLDSAQEAIRADPQGCIAGFLRPVQHEWLERFLALQAADAEPWVAEVQFHYSMLPPGAVSKLQLDGTATLLPDAAAVEAMSKRLASIEPESINAPRLLVLPRQYGDLSVLSEVAYVKEYRLEVVEPGDVEILDPIVDVIQEGLVTRVRAQQVSEGLYGLELDCSIAEIERPIPTRKVKVSSLHATEVEVGLPKVGTAQIVATLRLADGGGALLIVAGPDSKRDLAVLVRFQRRPFTPMPEASAPPGEARRER